MYEKLIRPILFKFDPELMHNTLLFAGRLMGSNALTRSILSNLFNFSHKALRTQVCGINFNNPLGIAAGYDKNAYLYNVFHTVGFGHAEMGSITAKPYKGNPKPRLKRLIADKGILVNYGLMNQGVEKICQRLKGKRFKIPMGMSVAKSNDSNIKGKDSVKDYVYTFKKLQPLADYVTINVSCPNSGDGRLFSEPDLLKSLLEGVSKEKTYKPIFLKLKPDLDNNQINEIIETADKFDFVNGFVLTNLTKDRKGLKSEINENDKGSVSGLPVKERSNNIIKKFYKISGDRYKLIGCGGIFTGKDAFEKIILGSSLLQLITAMIYEGPAVIKEINKELVKELHENGFNKVSEAVGSKS